MTWWTAKTIRKKAYSLKGNLANRLSFSEAIEAATLNLNQFLIKDLSAEAGNTVSSPLAKLLSEIRQYFKTGNCEQGIRKAASANPTILQPTTGKWLPEGDACPFSPLSPAAPEGTEFKGYQERNPHRLLQSRVKEAANGLPKEDRQDHVLLPSVRRLGLLLRRPALQV